LVEQLCGALISFLVLEGKYCSSELSSFRK
jgi:hypothetical protein